MAGADLTEEQRAGVVSLLESPLDFPPEFKDWVPQFLAQTIPYLPLSQIAGVGSVQPWFGVDNTASSPTETGVWGDILSTAGPRVDSVSRGDYLVIWGFEYEAGNEASTLDAGVSINGDDPVAPAAILGSPGLDEGYASWKACRITVPTDNSFVKLKYRFTKAGSPDGTCTGSNRWLILIRVK